MSGFKILATNHVNENSNNNWEQQEKNIGGYVDRYGNFVPTTEEEYARAREHEHHHRNHGHGYHGWACSPRNVCWGLAWFVGIAFLVLGVLGFGAAVYNGSKITTLETDVATLKSTTASQQALIDKAVVPFDHTSAGPLQIGPKTQYINVAAVAAMTLPGDLSSYLDDPYCVISKTAFPHTITMGAGATWDGANTIATFGGAAGDMICFHVFSSTQVAVGPIQNIAFS